MTRLTEMEEDAWCSRFADQLQGKLVNIGTGVKGTEFQKHVIAYALNILRPGGFLRKKGADVISVKEGPAQGGNIGLYAQSRRMSVAVECDNEKMIKKKSLQKLLFSDADLCMAISRGAEGDEDFASKTSSQIKQAFAECGSLAPERDVFLLILSQDIMLRLHVFNDDGKTDCEISKVYPFCSYSR